MADERDGAAKAVLDKLGQALLTQLEPGEGSRWQTVELRMHRESLSPHVAAALDVGATVESYRLEMVVRFPEGDQLRIPRAETVQACTDLDRVSYSGSAPRWRSLRFLLSRQVDGRPRYQCWWEYDQPDAV